VDLEAQRVEDDAGFGTTFSIEVYRREMLLRGLDEIGRTLLVEDKITEYELHVPQ
jgi:3-isopropylmalate/(R)-2-methylmalate dehydratase small subunit